ncbi:MAG TPA: type II secretion system minor pseudopilin GspK [Arenimonas sp.]|nr:type II secretion system minor pseudopilin GspK [Arenimonas sp.]
MRRQRGIALILALLALVLAVLLATALIDRGEQTAARWRTGWRAEQSWQLLQGLELWAREALLADARDSRSDSLDEPWARESPVLQVPGGEVRGRLRDLGGCFNLNSLVKLGDTDALAVQRFQRLLKGLQLPIEIAAQAADWIDRDSQLQSGGAEDGHYLAMPPRTRTGNTGFADASELLRLPAMTPEHWQRLRPLVCALPSDHRINLNTAPPELWLVLNDAMTLAIARRLARTEARPYSHVTEVQEAMQREGLPRQDDMGAFDVLSRYVLIEAEVRADGLDFRYQSLLQRGDGEVRVLARARGGAGSFDREAAAER